MSAYRSLGFGKPFVLRVALLPDAVIFGVIAVAATLVSICFALTRPVTIACTRNDDLGPWTCTVSRPLHSTTLEVPRVQGSGFGHEIVQIEPLDDAGSRLVANGRELARFSRRDGASAMQAARDLSNRLGEAGAREVTVRITRQPSSDWLIVAGCMLLTMLVACAYFRPVTFMIDKVRGVLVVKQEWRLWVVPLTRITGIRAVEREVSITLDDGREQTFAPVGWTHAAAVASAKVLRKATACEAA
jgi:hypothetical protein